MIGKEVIKVRSVKGVIGGDALWEGKKEREGLSKIAVLNVTDRKK